MNDEAQFAKKITRALDQGGIDADTARKLAEARKKAVAAMAQPVRVAALRPVADGWHHVVEFSHEGGYRFWLPVMLLLAGLLAVLGSNFSQYGNAPIDTDALLLASDLPPEAYADKEFVAWLEQSSQ